MSGYREAVEDVVAPMWDSKVLEEEIAAEKTLSEEQKVQMQALVRDYHDTFMTTPSGRRVLWHILQECGVFAPHTQFNASMYHKEGQRFVGLKLMSLTGLVNPAALYEIHRQMQEDKKGERKR